MASSKTPKVCMETSPFISLIWNEPRRADVVNAVLTSARSGTIELYTSFLTLVEVVKVPDVGNEDIAERRLEQFFRNRYIRKQEVNWYVAQEARHLQRAKRYIAK